LSEQADVDAVVRSLFTVKDVFDREEGSKEYSIAYDEATRGAFRALYDRVRPLGLTPRLFGTREDASLALVRGDVPGSSGPTRTPIFLLLLSIVAIVGAGWLIGDIYVQVEGGSALVIGAEFAAGLVVVLVAKGLVQRFLVRRSGGVSTILYYLPNIPFFIALPVLYFLPTFGAITSVHSPTVDRDSLFDCYFYAPVLGVAVALAVALVGATTAIALTHDQYVAIFGSGSLGTLNTNPSLLQSAAISLSGYLGLSPAVPPGGVVIYSPLEVAAWIGFLLSFFSLLPAALFDGGRMATLALGYGGSRITTMATGFVLVAVDVPNYWVVFLIIFLLAAIQPSNETLDSISGLSRSRKALFLATIALVLLCAPVPQNFLTYPL
jgi:membrane-associated protease RseP (regulator of RpoE activity)